MIVLCRRGTGWPQESGIERTDSCHAQSYFSGIFIDSRLTYIPYSGGKTIVKLSGAGVTGQQIDDRCSRMCFPYLPLSLWLTRHSLISLLAGGSDVCRVILAGGNKMMIGGDCP